MDASASRDANQSDGRVTNGVKRSRLQSSRIRQLGQPERDKSDYEVKRRGRAGS
jgi:hypothetical protein